MAKSPQNPDCLHCTTTCTPGPLIPLGLAMVHNVRVGLAGLNSDPFRSVPTSRLGSLLGIASSGGVGRERQWWKRDRVCSVGPQERNRIKLPTSAVHSPFSSPRSDDVWHRTSTKPHPQGSKVCPFLAPASKTRMFIKSFWYLNVSSAYKYFDQCRIAFPSIRDSHSIKKLQAIKKKPENFL